MTRLAEPFGGGILKLLLMTATPHPQPHDDRATDRDDRAATQADHDAGQLLPANGSVHAMVIKHIAECHDCRAMQFAIFLDAIHHPVESRAGTETQP